MTDRSSQEESSEVSPRSASQETEACTSTGQLTQAISDRPEACAIHPTIASNQSQQQLMRLINALPGIVFAAANDPGWTMTYLSHGCLKLTGYCSEELVGDRAITTYSTLTHTEDLPKVLQAIRRAIATQQPYVVEYRIRTKSGAEKWLWEKGYGVFDTSGQLLNLEGFITDITDRKLAEEALQQAETNYRSMVENAVEGVFQTSVDGRYRIVNFMLARIYGYDSPTELITNLTNIRQQLYVDPTRRDEFARLMQKQGAVWGFESQIYRRDGSTIWISECARALYNEQGELAGYEGTVEDITQRKQSEIELQRRDILLQGVAEATSHLLTHPSLEVAIPDVLAILGQAAGTDRIHLYANHPHPHTGQMSRSLRFEWTQEHIRLQSGRSQASQSQFGHLGQNLLYSAGVEHWYAALSQGQAVKEIIKELPNPEREFLNQLNILAVLMVPIFVDSHFWGYIGFNQCVTERQWSAIEESSLVAIAASIGAAIKRQRTEEQMRHQAFHDALTGLPNRALFNYRLPQAIDQARQMNELLAVLFLDLDRFKTINDTLGHAVGDRLLQQATDRLSWCMRQKDTIARWGGDEFTLIVPGIKITDEVIDIAQRLSAALKPAFYLEGHELYITGSIGIALYPHHGRDAQTLLKHADAALYKAKAKGRNTFQFYNATINSQATELLTLDSSLHQALERNEFTLYYQPQINIGTGEVTQMEALLRWQHPRLGLVSPKTFISLAEENGLIVPLGEWALRAACFQNRVWQAAGLAATRVAVNLSARQFEQPDLVDRVAQILQETGLDPTYLELEITETAAMRDVDFTTAILRRLQDMGIRIAIDDFGTGYSSLTYLKKFPLNALKIDQSFVRDLTKDADDMAIIKAIITLAKGLNLNVVAEGVETQEQQEKLRSLGCYEMQGYWLSPPLDAQVATQFLCKHHGKETHYCNQPVKEQWWQGELKSNQSERSAF